MDMDLKTPQAPLVEPEKPKPLEDPFKPDNPVAAGKKGKAPRQKHDRQAGKKFLKVLMVLILLGGVGYGVYYWQHQQVDKFAKQVQGLTAYVFKLQADNAKLEKENEELSKATASSKNVIKIPELGVQFTVPDTLRDITYTIRNGKYDDGTTFIAADLSTKTLTALDKQCASDATPALGGLFRSDGTGPKTTTSSTGPSPALKQFTGFYVSQSFGNASCSTDKTIQEKVSSSKIEYTAAVKSISLIQ